jgi:hypothetical protein
MGKISYLYSVEPEIDTNGFTLVAKSPQWYNMLISMYGVLGSNPVFMHMFLDAIYDNKLFFTAFYRRLPVCTGIYLYTPVRMYVLLQTLMYFNMP